MLCWNLQKASGNGESRAGMWDGGRGVPWCGWTWSCSSHAVWGWRMSLALRITFSDPLPPPQLCHHQKHS